MTRKYSELATPDLKQLTDADIKDLDKKFKEISANNITAAMSDDFAFYMFYYGVLLGQAAILEGVGE